MNFHSLLFRLAVVAEFTFCSFAALGYVPVGLGSPLAWAFLSGSTFMIAVQDLLHEAFNGMGMRGS